MNPRQWFRVSGSVASAALFVAGLLMVTAPALAQGSYTVPSTAIGATSATQTVTVTITKAGTLNKISVLTQGASGLDYLVATGGSCAVGTAYTTLPATSCTVNITFKPTHPWVRYGGISLFDSSNNLLGNSFLNGTGTGPQVAYPLSASSVPSLTISSFSSPRGIAVDGSGNIYVADTGNHAVKELLAVGGVVPASPTIVTWTTGFTSPTGIAVDGSGNIYVADTTSTGVGELIAVGGVVPPGATPVTLGSGFSSPTGVAVDGNGNVYVADSVHNAIKEIVAVNGVIPSSAIPTTLSSAFSLPAGVAVDGSGNVYVADTGHGVITELAAGSLTPTTLGTGFTSPTGVVVDGTGNVYVADSSSNPVKEIIAAGGGTIALGSGFSTPYGVAVDASGDVYVADKGNNAAKEMNDQIPPSLAFASTAVGLTSTDSPKSVIMANSGNANLNFTVPPSVTTNFSLIATSSCLQLASSPGSLAAGASCTDSVSFTPTQTGTPLTGTLSTTDNATGSPHSSSLSGTATPGTPIVTASSTSAVVDSTSVTLTAQVSYGGVAPTGAVTFTVNGGSPVAALCIGASSPLTCTANFNPSSLPVVVGGYPIVAKVAADGNYIAAQGAGTLTMNPAPTTLTISPTTPSIVNGPVTFTATLALVPSSTAFTVTTVATDTVSFTGNGVAIAGCTGVSLSTTNHTATCTTSSLVAPSASIVATFNPVSDPNFSTSTAATVTQTVNPATTKLTISPTTTATVNASVTVTATLSSTASFFPITTASTDTVSFTVNGVPLCTASLSTTTQIATCSTTSSSLVGGTDAIGATFNPVGDLNFSTSTASTAPQTVNPASATLAISSWPASASVDLPASFTATLSTPGGFTVPTASADMVTFTLNGTTVLCTSPLIQSTQIATCSATTGLVAGTDTVTAALLPGDPSYYSSGTPPFATGTASLANTATTVSAPSSPNVNQTVTLTATVAPASGYAQTTLPKTGTISFSDSASSGTFCTGNIVGGVVPTCSHSFASSGPRTITATYASSDPNFTGSTSSGVAVNVGTSNTTIAVSAGSANLVPVSVDQTGDTFLAAITNFPSNTPGTITYYDGATAISGANCSGVSVLSSGAPASSPCPYTFATAGQHSITAVFTQTGSSSPLVLTSSALNVTVAQTTLTLKATPPSPQVGISTPFTVTVSLPSTITDTVLGDSTPSSSITFTPDVGTPCTTAVVGTSAQVSCPLTFGTSGVHTVTVSYGSDANFTATNITDNVTVGQTGLTLTATPPSPLVDTPATFTAAISQPSSGSTIPTGKFTFTDSTSGTTCTTPAVAATGAGIGQAQCSLTLGTAGSHAITVSYGSDSNFSAASIPDNVTVGQTPLTLSAPPTGTPPSPQVNSPTTFTASVTLPSTATGSTVPNGTITFTPDNNGAPCSALVAANGQASCLLKLATAGSHTITVSYGSDPNFSAASTTEKVTVTATGLTLSAISPGAQVDTPATFTAAISQPLSGSVIPSGTVTFTDTTPGATTTPCTAAVATSGTSIGQASCSLTLGTAGSHTITVSYGSDSNYSAANLTETVTVAQTVLTLKATPPSPQLSTPATFTAAVSLPSTATGSTVPNGTITFTPDVGTPCSSAVATSGSTIGQASCLLTFATAGTHTVTVSYSNDNNFSAANVPDNVTVGQAPPTITIASSLPTSVGTQTVIFTATLQSTTGVTPTGAVTFTVPQATVTNPLCTLAPVSAGKASCFVISIFPIAASGSVSVDASYSGDSNYTKGATPANGSTFPQTVQNFVLAVAPLGLTISQGNTNSSDAYTPQPISLTETPSGGFTDPLTVTCSFTPTPTTGSLSCPSTSATSVTIMASSSVAPGSYTVTYTVLDSKVPSLSYMATATVTVAATPPTITVGSLGTASASFTDPTSVALTTLSCNQKVAILSGGSYTISPSTLSQLGITCTNFAATGSSYTFTIKTGTQIARLETRSGGIVLACLGAPFLLMLGLLPASKRFRKALLHGLVVIAIGMLLLHATGCSSGGFSEPPGTHATDGIYLLDIVSGTTTVAEVPVNVQN